MQHDAPRTIAIGPAHRATIESPDLVLLSWNGEVEPGHMRAFYDLLEQVSGGRQILLLNDLHHSADPGPQARKVAVEDPRTLLIGALALVGASFRLRVIVTMMDKAVAVMQGQTRRTACFDEERAARAWLDAQRKYLTRVELPSAS